MQKIRVRQPCLYREKSATTGELVAAMAKATAEFLPLQFDQTGVGFDADGREYEYRYASLAAINKATKAALSKNDLWLHCDYGFDEEGVFACVVLEHKTGEFVASTLPVPQYGTIHQQKAAMTLMRRAAIEGLLGLSAEEDTDAQCCAGEQPAEATQPAAAVDPKWQQNEAMAFAAIESAEDDGRVAEIVAKVKQKIERGRMDPSALARVEEAASVRRRALLQMSEVLQ